MDVTGEEQELADESPAAAGTPGPGGRHSRRFSRRLRHALSQAAVRALGFVLPWLYVAYCWFVWRTSRVVDRVNPTVQRGIARHGRMVALLWHQEVFTVAWAYRSSTPHTLASTGNFGHLITRLLERCNFVVFRGGSSRGTARRRKVLPELIRHMRETPDVVYGITVDGSNGPVFKLKHGGPMIARVCRAPIFLARFWCARKFQLPTWDRTIVPLPFNRIVMDMVGPYWIDPDCNAQEFQRAVTHLEEELLALTDRTLRAIDPAGDPELQALFPPGWESPWVPGVPGRRLTRWDLRDDVWPEWAHLAPDRAT